MTKPSSYAIDFGLAEYQDTGCPDGEFPACLQCPLIICKYEDPRWDGKQRNDYQEVRDMLSLGLSVGSVVAATGLSKRTVFRVKSGK